MKKRLALSITLLILTSLFSYAILGLLEGRAKPFDFERKIPVSVKFVEILKNEGYGKILSLNDDSTVFLDKTYQHVEVKKIGHPSLPIPTEKTPENGTYFFLSNGGVTNQGTYSFCGNCQQVFYAANGKRTIFNVNTTFVNAVLINDQTIILRNNNLKHEFVLGKYNFRDKKVKWSTMNTHSPNRGGLATDGSLVYDGNKYLYFVNRYNSSILKFDPELKVHAVFHTLDASRELPEVVYLQKSHSYHFSSAKNAINERVAVYGNTLYVLSAAKGKNDLTRGATYIDSYDMQTGNYLVSYPIPRKMGPILDIKTDKQGKLYILTPESLKLIQLK